MGRKKLRTFWHRFGSILRSFVVVSHSPLVVSDSRRSSWQHFVITTRLTGQNHKFGAILETLWKERSAFCLRVGIILTVPKTDTGQRIRCFCGFRFWALSILFFLFLPWFCTGFLLVRKLFSSVLGLFSICSLPRWPPRSIEALPSVVLWFEDCLWFFEKYLLVWLKTFLSRGLALFVSGDSGLLDSAFCSRQPS